MSNGTLENLMKQLIALNGNITLLNENLRVTRNADPKTGVPDVIDVTDNEVEYIPTLDGEPLATPEELKELDEATPMEPVIAGKNTWLLMQDDTPLFVAKGEEMPHESDIEKRITKKQFEDLNVKEDESFDDDESFDEEEEKQEFAKPESEDDEFLDEDEDDNETISFDHFKEIIKLFGSGGKGARAKKVLAGASSTGSEKLSSFADDAAGRTKAIEVLKAKWPKFDKAAEKVGYEV